MSKLLPSLVIVAALLAPSIAQAQKSVLVDRIAAVVDDGVIFRSDVIAYAKPLLARLPEAEKTAKNIDVVYKQVLEKLIDDALIANEAERMHLTVTDEEVERAVDAIAGTNKISRAELEAEVKKNGLSLPEYRDELRRQVLDAKWTQLRVGGRLKPPAPDAKTSEADRAKAMMAALEVERRKALSELRERSFVEVRW